MSNQRTTRSGKPAPRAVRSRSLTFDDVRAIARTIPGIDEVSSYGTPRFKVRGKFLGRLHEDGESLVLKMDLESRAFLTRVSPDVYSFTEHYRNYPIVLIRYAAADTDALREHFEDAWRGLASKRQIAEYKSQSVPSR